MDFRRGWDLNDEERILLEHMMRALDAGDVGLRYNYRNGAVFRGEDEVENQLNELSDRGIMDLSGSDSDGIDFRLTTQGKQTARAVRDRRENKLQRRMDLRDALLYFVSSENGSGTVDRFLASKYSWYYGEQVTPGEIDIAARFLETEGWIEARKGFGGVVDMTSTAKGDRLVETAHSVNDPQDPGVTMSYDQSTNIHTAGGPAYTQTHSPNATQNILNGEAGDLALAFAQRLEHALPELGLTEDAAALPAEIREAVEAHNPRFLRRVLESAVTQLAASTMTALASPLVAEAVHVTHQLI